jgi:hypothetical protein
MNLVNYGLVHMGPASLSFVKWLARWHPEVGWWGPRSNVCLEVDTLGRHKMPCCAHLGLCLSLPSIYSLLVFVSVGEKGGKGNMRVLKFVP